MNSLKVRTICLPQCFCCTLSRLLIDVLKISNLIRLHRIRCIAKKRDHELREAIQLVTEHPPAAHASTTQPTSSLAHCAQIKRTENLIKIKELRIKYLHDLIEIETFDKDIPGAAQLEALIKEKAQVELEFAVRMGSTPKAETNNKNPAKKTKQDSDQSRDDVIPTKNAFAGLDIDEPEIVVTDKTAKVADLSPKIKPVILSVQGGIQGSSHSGAQRTSNPEFRVRSNFRVIPEQYFSGVESVSEFLENIDNNLTYYEIPTQLACAYLKGHLTGRALDWFNVLGYRVVEDKATDYAHLKQALKEQFPVVRNRSELETRFYAPFQKHNQRPSNFVYELLKIHKQFKLDMEEEKLSDHVISRLEPQLLDYVEVRHPQTTSNLLQIIDKYQERFLNRRIRGLSQEFRDAGHSASSPFPNRNRQENWRDTRINNRYSDISRPQREFNIFEGQGVGNNCRFDSRRRSGQSDHRYNNQGGRQGGSRNGAFRGQNDQPGLIHILYHKINTGDQGPVVSRPYRYDSVKQGIIDYHIEKILQEGTIRPIQSPYASLAVLTRKNNGLPPDSPEAYLFVIDYRKLNAITKYPGYSLRVIDELITNNPHTAIMLTLDLKSGYFQLAINPKDIEKTAFNTKWHFRISQNAIRPFRGGAKFSKGNRHNPKTGLGAFC
ncbi:uncharacterized protein TNCV_3916841 [Trichonephila clavipes]|nr:uncharacterized protein TNCV_3916841 [Trichonephila clavipes]